MSHHLNTSSNGDENSQNDENKEYENVSNVSCEDYEACMTYLI